MDDRLTQMAEKAFKFRDDRDWKQFHDPKNLSEAISVEAGELLEIFRWIDTNKSYEIGSSKKVEIGEEVADIMIYLLYLCEGLNIDITEAVKRKIDLNDKKYPVSKSKGNSKKYKDFD